jgi:hypothetical protein
MPKHYPDASQKNKKKMFFRYDKDMTNTSSSIIVPIVMPHYNLMICNVFFGSA